MSVVIPTYNEVENIVPLIYEIKRRLRNRLYEIIVIDDNSPDGTGKKIQTMFRNDRQVNCYIRFKKPELGRSILLGIQKARGDIIIGMDADFNHDPKLLPRLLHQLRNADMVIASRFISGGGMVDKFRYYTSYWFNLMLRMLFRFPLKDNTSGYYAIRKRSLLLLHPSRIYFGYGEYHLRLVFFAATYGLRLKEIPVSYPKRSFGKSKSKPFSMIWTYTKTAYSMYRH